MRAIVGGGFTLLSLFLLMWISTSLYICTPVFSVIFQGLDLLKRAGSLWEEAHRLEVEAQHLENEALGKMEVVVAGSEVDGFYGLLRGAISHSSISSASPPHKKIYHTPSTTISYPLPQDLMSLILQTRQCSLPLQLFLQLQRRPSPPTCDPFVFSWGHPSSIPEPG